MTHKFDSGGFFTFLVVLAHGAGCTTYFVVHISAGGNSIVRCRIVEYYLYILHHGYAINASIVVSTLASHAADPRSRLI